MMLHNTMDGKTCLYIEQNHGARLAVFDVTDPARVKAEGWALVEAPGSFDFVSSLGADAVPVRFRNGQEEAVLNLHKAKTPALNMIQGLYFQASIGFWGDNVLMVSKRPSLQSDISDADYQIVDISNPVHPNAVTDIKQVLKKDYELRHGHEDPRAADEPHTVRTQLFWLSPREFEKQSFDFSALSHDALDEIDRIQTGHRLDLVVSSGIPGLIPKER